MFSILRWSPWRRRRRLRHPRRDPWQALYGFRGAKPNLVPKVMTQQNFGTFPCPLIPISEHRHEDPQRSAAELRSSNRCLWW